MNRRLLILIVPMLMLISSCIGKYSSDAQEAKIGKAQDEPNSRKEDTIQVDLSKSSIHWRGTKMRGAGKHEGQIDLISGFFLLDRDNLVGGRFTIDMNSIQVTDIPEHEPVPRKRFNNHMRSEDFFHTSKYPTSEFTITKINDLANDSILVSGNLTIKDITRNVNFKAINRKGEFCTKFKFDRFEWNIAYKGSWADKTLVDKDIELSIKLKMK
ncbi:MAG: YceI family protein [Salinimicrobium sp.]